MTSLQRFIGTSACGWALACGAALATPLDIANCVSSEHLQIADADRSALLDPPDRAQVSAAMLQQYPMLARDQFLPSQIVLWQKPGGDWLYVTLVPAPDDAAQLCVNATFSADSFELTPPLLDKYFVKI
jgi:hypothetical protein